MTVALPVRPTTSWHAAGTRWVCVVRRMRWGYRVHIEDGEYHLPIRWWCLFAPSQYRRAAWWVPTQAAAHHRAELEARKGGAR